ncbi:hypothetical protein D3C71_2050690 [compost metagenome]
MKVENATLYIMRDEFGEAIAYAIFGYPYPTDDATVCDSIWISLHLDLLIGSAFC